MPDGKRSWFDRQQEHAEQTSEEGDQGVAEQQPQAKLISLGDHSCSDLLRNATTTPANPASATAIWAAVDRASPGSIALGLDRIQATRTNTKFAQDREGSTF